MKILEEILEISQNDVNPYLEKAKDEGKKIIGYFCSYVPEEVLHAAGLIPFRMRAVGSSGTSMGDTYFAATICSFVRHCFDKALNGNFSFLDGVIFMNGCDHNRRMYDNWRYAKIAPDFLYMLPVPHVITDLAIDKYTKELNKLTISLQDHYGVDITRNALLEAIRLYNRKRELLIEIYESRKQMDVPIKGSEFLSIMLAVTALPVEIAIDLLEKVVKELPGRKVSSDGDLRLFMAAACIEEIEHMKLIEECGSIVVADKICLGASHFHTLVKENSDPVHAIAERYLTHLSCPRMMDDFKRRMQYMHDEVNTYNVDAVIVEQLEFCTLMAGETFMYKNEAKKGNIPILTLDRELYGGGTGQIKTRVQAFFEQVKNMKEFSDN